MLSNEVIFPVVDPDLLSCGYRALLLKYNIWLVALPLAVDRQYHLAVTAAMIYVSRQRLSHVAGSRDSRDSRLGPKTATHTFVTVTPRAAGSISASKPPNYAPMVPT